jgi:hypothetical protein
MLILISISGCGTLIGQTLSKTAFAVTLLRITNKWQRAILGFCIVSMHVYMATKLFVTWAKYCDQKNYQNSWRMQGFCINYTFVQGLKTGGNVYNITMDFVLALFPWMVVWKLNMKTWEKIGLCAAMSLGMVIAIITAVRTAWTEFPSTTQYDDWYFCKSPKNKWCISTAKTNCTIRAPRVVDGLVFVRSSRHNNGTVHTRHAPSRPGDQDISHGQAPQRRPGERKELLDLEKDLGPRES